MPTIITSNLPAPKDDVEFQELIRDLFAAHWKDENVQNYGRSGQAQNGVDVYLLGNPLQKKPTFAIQCKVRKNRLSRKEIEEEVKMARSFKTEIDKYIFTTTLERDKKVQDLIDELNLQETGNGGFEINIKFWEDIIALLAEHPKIVEKYYPQFYNGKSSKRLTKDRSVSNFEINENSPLIVGCLVDLSKSMVLETLSKLSKPLNFEEFTKYMVFKITSFCKSKDSQEVMDKVQLFMLGYGLGSSRKKAFKLISRLGLGSKKNDPNLISDEPIRDLFAETALKESVPYSPKLSTLNRYWSIYQESLERQLFDFGSGDSDLYNGLISVNMRFEKEFSNPHFSYPLLIIISNGKFDNCQESDLVRISKEIKEKNIQIACFFIDENDVTNKYELYNQSKLEWKEELKILFKMSSHFKTENRFYSEILEVAKENEWNISKDSRMFFQVNHKEMINELIDLIFQPLQLQ